MFLIKRLILLLSLACNPLQGTETDHQETSEALPSYRSLSEKMEDVEKAITVSQTSNPEKWVAEPYQDRLFLLESDMLQEVLSNLINYRDQLAYLMCCKSAKNYGVCFTKTHINNLTSSRKEEERTPHLFIALLTNLKFLCIIQSNIDNVHFNAQKLEGLAIRSSTVHPNLLLSQKSLFYLDVRTPFLNNPGSGILQQTLKSNPCLLVLKANIDKSEGESENIYKNLPKLESVEFVDITNNLVHVDQLVALRHLREIIFSSFEVGLLEVHYKNALKIIYQKIPFNSLQIKLKCINDSEQWEVTYTDVKFRRMIEYYFA